MFGTKNPKPVGFITLEAFEKLGSKYIDIFSISDIRNRTVKISVRLGSETDKLIN